MTQAPSRICILGGGFGGLYTALRLSQFPWDQANRPDIVLIDQRDRFLFSPLLYELMTGELQTWEISPPFVELLTQTGIRFYQATVTDIQVDNHRLQFQDGGEMTYDYLVLALGGETPMHSAPGVIEHAFSFRTIDDAYRLEERLRRLEESETDKIRVAIVGAGYIGVELACKLAERLGDRGRLRLVELSDQILRTSTEYNRTTATEALRERGIWIDLETQVTNIQANAIALDYKGKVDEIPVDIVLWTVGNKVPDVVKALPLKQNQRGQLVVTPTLQVAEHTNLFAVGDLADCRDAEGQTVPASAQAAIQQAEFVGWNLWALLTEKPLLPFRYQFLGEMMTLGTADATLSSMGLTINGQLAYVARRLAYLYRMPTLEHQLRVGLNWILRPLLSISR